MSPRLRRAIPWADIVLFFFIGAVLAFWWLRAPAGPAEQQVALLATTPGISEGVDARTSITPQTPLPQPTATPQPSPTPTPAPTTTPVPAPARHKVQSGESFGIIADKYGSTAKDIAEANGLTVGDMIYPGQELIVPVAGASGGPGPTATPSGGTLLYSVQPGDTISEIAERLDSQLDWILQANKRKATDMLRPGDQLLIPLSNRTPTPGPTLPPTVTSTPSITPEAMLRAPILLAPANDSVVAGDGELLLRWASAGVLAKEQWYVVTVRVSGSDAPIAPYWTKGTTWRLPADYRIPGRDATRFLWQVQVMLGAPGQANPKPASLPSEPRAFSWTK